jgi:translation initiation factor IF-3
MKTKKRKKKSFKEMRFRPNIADNDLNTKVRQIRKFLGKSLQVRVTVQMRGREITHKDIAHCLLNKIRDATQDVGKMDSGRKDAGRDIQTMISPLSK